MNDSVVNINLTGIHYHFIYNLECLCISFAIYHFILLLLLLRTRKRYNQQHHFSLFMANRWHCCHWFSFIRSGNLFLSIFFFETKESDNGFTGRKRRRANPIESSQISNRINLQSSIYSLHGEDPGRDETRTSWWTRTWWCATKDRPNMFVHLLLYQSWMGIDLTEREIVLVVGVGLFLLLFFLPFLGYKKNTSTNNLFTITLQPCFSLSFSMLLLLLHNFSNSLSHIKRRY